MELVMSYQLRMDAHRYFLGMGYYLINEGPQMYTDDGVCMNEAIVAAYLGLTDLSL